MIINLNLLETTHFSVNPTWLKSLRKRELQAFLKRGFPSRKEEDWKYIDLTKLQNISFKPTLFQDKCSSLKVVSRALFPKNAAFVFVNGYFSSELSNLSKIPEEVIALPLTTAIETHTDLIRPFLEKSDPKTHPFVCLNTAFLSEGVFLYVKKNSSLKAPIHCIYFNSNHERMCHTRTLLYLEENSQLNFVEHMIGDLNAQYFHNHVTQIELSASSELNYYKLQQESLNAYHLANIQVNQQTNSHLSTFHATTGGKLSRDDLDVKLTGKNAKSKLKGFYTARDKQCIDHHITTEHKAKQTQSEQHYKGILKDYSKAIFNGKVIVHKEAKQTVARQANQNILLSNTAEIDTKPELEIYTDDVKCSHGATVGPLEQEAIFYLQSRGMSKELASRLLIDAFFNELITAIPFPEVVQKLNTLI